MRKGETGPAVAALNHKVSARVRGWSGLPTNNAETNVLMLFVPMVVNVDIRGTSRGTVGSRDALQRYRQLCPRSHEKTAGKSGTWKHRSYWVSGRPYEEI